MDRAYEDNETRQLALDFGFIPVVPPKSNRLEPWQYDKALYRKRNEVERLFRRLKGFRRIFSRFDKLAVLFLGFLNFALIVEALRSVNTPWAATGDHNNSGFALVSSFSRIIAPTCETLPAPSVTTISPG